MDKAGALTVQNCGSNNKTIFEKKKKKLSISISCEKKISPQWSSFGDIESICFLAKKNEKLFDEFLPKFSQGVTSEPGRYREGSKKHLDDPVPNGDFAILHCLGIRSSVLGIGLDHIGK